VGGKILLSTFNLVTLYLTLELLSNPMVPHLISSMGFLVCFYVPKVGFSWLELDFRATAVFEEVPEEGGYQCFRGLLGRS